MAEQIRIDLVAADDASETIRDVADEAERLEGLTPEIAVTADDQATATVEQVDALVADLEGTTGEVVVTADAGTAEADVTAVADAVAALPIDGEVVVTADTGTAESDIKSVGDTAQTLSHADYELVLKAKVDQARADLKSFKDTAGETGTAAAGSVDKVGDAVHRVGGEADNTRSVVANFAGNVSSEMPGVAGAFGPLNQAVGQFGEYAAEGNIALGNLVAAAGPMLAVSIALQGIMEQLGEAGKAQAFDKEQVDAFADSLAEGGDQAQALADRLREAGEVTADLFSSGKSFEVTEQLTNAGLTVDQFSKLVVEGQDAINGWRDAQIAAGNAGSDLDTAYVAASEQAGNYATAQDAAATSAKFFGEDTKLSAYELDNMMSSAEGGAERVKLLADQQERATQAAQDHADALLEEADASLDVAGAFRDQAEIGQDLRDAQRDVMRTAGDAKRSTDDLNRSCQKAADLQTDYARAAKTAAGETFDETDALDANNDSLITQAGQLNGPQRKALTDYIGQINGIPEKKMTAIEAAIARGDLDEAERLLNNASRARTATMTADANSSEAEREINNVARDRESTITVYGSYPSGFLNGPGGVVYPGPRALPPVDGGAGGPPVATPYGAGGPTEIINVTQVLPRGYREADVLTAARRAARRSGGLYQRARR